jgi:hypothetical protein
MRAQAPHTLAATSNHRKRCIFAAGDESLFLKM